MIHLINVLRTVFYANKKTINLPKELLEEAVRLSGANTQTMAIVLALEEFVKKKKRDALLKLKGSDAINLGKRSINIRFRPAVFSIE